MVFKNPCTPFILALRRKVASALEGLQLVLDYLVLQMLFSSCMIFKGAFCNLYNFKKDFFCYLLDIKMKFVVFSRL